MRLPEAFAERLFAVTEPGTVVVVADRDASPPALVAPGLFSPIDAATGTPRAQAEGARSGEWRPERAPEGPLRLLLSTADRELVIRRIAVEITGGGSGGMQRCRRLAPMPVCCSMVPARSSPTRRCSRPRAASTSSNRAQRDDASVGRRWIQAASAASLRTVLAG